MASKSLTFDIFGRDRTASKTMKGIGDNADSLGRRFQGVAKGIGIAAAAGIAALSVAAIGFANESVKAFAEAETQQRKLEDAFERFPALASTNIEAIRKMNSALAKKTRFDDDAIAVGQAQLAQYGLTGDQLKEMTPLLLDYAARTGKDVAGAAEDLGKALLGQGRALKDVGIDFQDTGSVAGNFAQLMSGLGSQVAGFAEKDAATAAGQLEILRNRFGEIQEKIGEALMPALSQLMDFFETDVMPGLEGFANWFVSDGLPAIQSFIGFLNENKGTFIPIAAGIASITAALWLLNAALALNPIVLAVGAILAAAAVSASIIAWMINDWKGYLAFTKQMDRTISGIWEGFVGFIVGIVAQIIGAIGRLTSGIGAKIGEVVSLIQSIPGRIAGALSGLGSLFFGSGQALIQGFINGITSKIAAAGAAVANVLQFVAGFFPHSPAERGPFSGTGWNAVRSGGAALMDQFASGVATNGLGSAVGAALASPTFGSGGAAAGSVASVRAGVAGPPEFHYHASSYTDLDPRVHAQITGREFARRAAGVL